MFCYAYVYLLTHAIIIVLAFNTPRSFSLHSAGDSGGLLNQCPFDCVGCVGGSGRGLGGAWLIVCVMHECVYVCCKIAHRGQKGL